MTREARLLLVTIVVSVALLFLLARYRFPSPARATSAAVPVAPLERLAARATYDELASIIAALEPMLDRAVVVLRIVPARTSARGDAAVDRPRFVPALRIRDDVAVAAIEPGARLSGFVGGDGSVPAIVGRDAVRGLAAVRVPRAPAPTVSISTGPLTGVTLRYVATVEGTTGGPAIRPVFLGRTDPVADRRWPGPLLAMGGVPTSEPGSLVFALDGRLIGLVVREDGMPALVSASALFEVAEPLARGESVAASDLGVEVQPLTVDIVRAVRAVHGAVVSHVVAGGPSADLLRMGDVIVSVEDHPIRSIEDFRHTEAALPAGRPVPLEIVRLGTTQTVQVTPRVLDARMPEREASLGLTLRAVPGRGAEVTRVAAGTVAAIGGIEPGDLITQVGDTVAPSPAQVRAAFDGASPGAALLIGLARDGVHRVVALHKP